MSSNQMRIEGGFQIGDGPLAILASNLLTDDGIASMVESAIAGGGTAPLLADWDYIAIGEGTVDPVVAGTALGIETCRLPITAKWSPATGRARYLVAFGPYEGNGPWEEVGLFDAVDKRGTIHECEGTVGWSSDGTLTQEGGVVQQGQASLRCAQIAAGTIAFQHGTMAPTMGTFSWGTADFFQFWYRTAYDVGTVTTRLGVDSSNYYKWDWVPGTVDAWALFHEQIVAGAKVGDPGIPGTAWEYFRLTHGAAGTAFNEYLDHLSFFGNHGTMFAHAGLNTSKPWNSVRNVYYVLRFFRT